MTKQQFLDELSRALAALPKSDIADSLEYYSEMIADRIESGMSEEDAVKELGTPDRCAHEILLSAPIPTLIKSRCKPRSAWRTWEIILLILGSPIWLALAISIFAIVISVYIALWSVVITFWALDVSLLACGLAFVFICPIGDGILTALLYIGLGFVSLGLVVPTFFGCHAITKIFIKLTAKVTKYIKRLIIGKKSHGEGVNA